MTPGSSPAHYMLKKETGHPVSLRVYRSSAETRTAGRRYQVPLQLVLLELAAESLPGQRLERLELLQQRLEPMLAGLWQPRCAMA